MLLTKALRLSYQHMLKPLLFAFDPELVHNLFTATGETLESCDWLVGRLFRYSNPKLHTRVLGVDFANPIGLAAGFDYDGHMARVMRSVGFGFNSVGSVTALSYEGNPGPRLGRLPKSRSLLVNKGFKSEGARAIARRLDGKNLRGHTVGISIGSSNRPEVNTIAKAVDDYLFTFDVFKKKPYVRYFELNISCPNTAMTESFASPANFGLLTKAIATLKLRQPIFVKMPNEIGLADSDVLVKTALSAGIHGFIFSNLVKKRDNPAFDAEEMQRFAGFKGNFSGKPAEAAANRLIAHTRKKFGADVALVGCGGVFSPEDARAKFAAGADLVQLITGMIFEGPQLVGEINKNLAE